MVPVVDLSRRGALRSAEFAELCQQILGGGTILLGAQTTAFEAEFGAWTSGGEAVAVSSGASAVQLALRAVGIGPGDEVIVPAFTAVPTAAAVCAVGAVPVFADVEPHSANLDPARVEGARTDRTKAVIVVHLYGRPAALPITDLSIIEDAAQAHGALEDATRSAATAYSFYPTKNLGGVGDGGAVVSTDPAVTEMIRRLRAHGMTEQYVHTDVSQNFRMSELEAAWLRLNLPSLAADNERRRWIAARYRDAAPGLRWQARADAHVYHLCVLRSSRREAFRRALQHRGVSTAVHYPLALTQQPAYAHLTRARCPQAEAWAAECISVPCFPELADSEVDLVAAALAATAGEVGTE
ncbi:MAG TPA: DegT/DnrJ/EryC1/StrS family aminotransferase [Ilumatobacteraceae bacterium]